MYRKDLNVGGWFSFNSNKRDWKSFYANKMFEHFFDVDMINKSFKGVNINEELLISQNLDFSSIKNKKVLVIGGGPSTKNLTDEKLNEYDFLFSCNHFYRNPLLQNKKIHVVLVGDEVVLEDSKFISYIKKFSPVLGFEHSSRRSTHNVTKFKRFYPKSFVYLTRYFSRLGYVARACVLAKCMGASHIDFIGLDGFKKKTHAFEKTKHPPPFNDEVLFQNQMKVFCEYMINDLQISEFNNLSENSDESIYKGILTGVKNEKN